MEITARKTTIRMSLVALFAGLTAAGTFIVIPLPFSPVPIVLQNLFAVLSGLLLGPQLGGAALVLYLGAGILGAPIFAGASGGIAHLLKPSAGYLLGYLLAAIVAGLIAGTPHPGKKDSRIQLIAATVCGFLIIYVPGVIRLKFALQSSLFSAFVAGFIPYIIGDTIKGVIAVLIAVRLRTLIAENLNL
ncbi:Biotin transporter BioY [Pillotina sp. SPG140]|jgi:biotin transport system substrate-specific component